jgi:uncharacterized membrane protein
VWRAILIRRGRRWIFIAVTLSQLRFPYPLLGLLIVSFPSHLLGSNRAARARFLFLFFAALFLPCLGWFAVIQRLLVEMRPLIRVDPTAQLQFVFNHPLCFFHIIGSGLAQWGLHYWHEAVGVFDWLTLPAPSWILLGVTLSLVVTICSCELESLRLTGTFRLFSFAMAAAGLLLTALIVYLAWNTVGAPQLEGWQGRYAIPLLPLVALAVANEWLRRPRWITDCAIAFSLLADVAAIAYVTRATYFQ